MQKLDAPFPDLHPQTPEEHLAAAVGGAMWANDHFPQLLGMRVLAVQPDLARLEMKITQTLANSHGIGHGGAIFALADTAFAYACNSSNEATVAAGVTIDFMRPAILGDTLVATAHKVHQGGRAGIYDVEVRNQDGKLVATFRGRSHRIDGKSAPGVGN